MVHQTALRRRRAWPGLNVLVFRLLSETGVASMRLQRVFRVGHRAQLCVAVNGVSLVTRSSAMGTRVMSKRIKAMERPKRPIRIATICHNDDSSSALHPRRVRLELRQAGGGYAWQTAEGADCELGIFRTVAAAVSAAALVWGHPAWDFRARWAKR